MGEISEMMRQPAVRTIYSGGYTHTLGIITEGDMRGWLVYRHVEGNWVTLANLGDFVENSPTPTDSPARGEG